MKLYLAILSILFICGCTDKPECTFEYLDAQKVTYKIKGCMLDSLEDGPWITYDTLDRIIEQGRFERGIRVGVWEYPTKSVQDRIVEWQRYVNDSLKFSTNVPNTLADPEERQYYVKWIHKDSSKLLNLVVAFHDLSENSIDIDSFFLSGKAEIEAKGFTFRHQVEKVLTNNKAYYFNFYVISSPSDFKMFNCYGVIDNKLVDITVKFREPEEVFARNLFASVLSNLFVDSSRFIYPFSQIR